MEGVSKALCELLEKKKAWYNKQLEHEREETHQVQVRLNNEIWAEMKKHNEDATAVYK